MNLLVFQLNPQGLLELVSEPIADDEDVPTVPVVIPQELAA